MKNCNFILKDELYVCEYCGLKVKKAGIKANCIALKPKPNIIQKATNFIPALTNHLWNGSPKCTQEQIEQRLTICKECPLFVGNSCSHNSCGCSINDKQVFLNKLYWADQKCPLDKWDVVSGSGV
jgi:hypothetical protein